MPFVCNGEIGKLHVKHGNYLFFEDYDASIEFTPTHMIVHEVSDYGRTTSQHRLSEIGDVTVNEVDHLCIWSNTAPRPGRGKPDPLVVLSGINGQIWRDEILGYLSRGQGNVPGLFVEGAAGRARRVGRRIADRARGAVESIRAGARARRNRRRNR